MITIREKAELRFQVKQWKNQGQRVGFVPTMGNFHEGHLSLVREAFKHADKVIVSVFVNPTQFDRNEDLQRYPRTENSDLLKLQNEHVDAVFLPSVEVMYASGLDATMVHVPRVSEKLEGASRGGHFSGVATIVTKLFNLVSPEVSVFGEKDYQQLMVIRKLVNDLDIPTDIVGHPTVREPDGLAMSSRNQYLTDEERQKAPELFKTLCWLEKQVLAKRGDFDQLIMQSMDRLRLFGFTPDYVQICHQENLETAQSVDQNVIILAAAWLGQARLIDNLPVQLV